LLSLTGSKNLIAIHMVAADDNNAADEDDKDVMLLASWIIVDVVVLIIVVPIIVANFLATCSEYCLCHCDMPINNCTCHWGTLVEEEHAIVIASNARASGSVLLFQWLKKLPFSMALVSTTLCHTNVPPKDADVNAITHDWQQ